MAAATDMQPPGAAQRRWRERDKLSAEERRSILDAVAIRLSPGATFRLGVMQLLAVVICVLGLITNSTAVVIGAMLVAPLMGPIVGISASLAMGWTRLAARNLALVVVAAILSVGVAALVSWLTPGTALTEEMLARTSPGTTDLLIALAAGVSGAYAIVRPAISASLPGVVIAVALVPPLATVGCTWQAGQTGLATGAALLFGTNLIAIILAGLVVFPLSGFVPAIKLKRERGSILLWAGLATVLVAAIASVLVARTSGPARQASRTAEAKRLVTAWLSGTGLELRNFQVKGNDVIVDLAGPEAPPEADNLARQLSSVLGPDAGLEVGWLQRSSVSADQPLVARLDRGVVESEVHTWMAETGFEVDSFVIAVEVNSDRVVISVTGPAPPPPGRGLELRLLDRVGFDVPVEVSSNVVVPEQDLATRVRDAASAWSADRSLVVDNVTLDVELGSVTIVVEGPTRPNESASLRQAVADALDKQITLTLLYRQAIEIPPGD